eukprot:10841400-Prorocentrum_lima.AAC.1
MCAGQHTCLLQASKGIHNPLVIHKDGERASGELDHVEQAKQLCQGNCLNSFCGAPEPANWSDTMQEDSTKARPGKAR